MPYLRRKLRAWELKYGRLIAHETKPIESIEDRLNGGIRGACPISVFDAEQELSTMMACIKPVEERRARAADMKVTRWRRGKSRYHALILDCCVHAMVPDRKSTRRTPVTNAHLVCRLL